MKGSEVHAGDKFLWWSYHSRAVQKKTVHSSLERIKWGPGLQLYSILHLLFGIAVSQRHNTRTGSGYQSSEWLVWNCSFCIKNLGHIVRRLIYFLKGISSSTRECIKTKWIQCSWFIRNYVYCELLVIGDHSNEPCLCKIRNNDDASHMGTCSCLVRVTGCSAGGKFFVYLFGLWTKCTVIYVNLCFKSLQFCIWS